MRFCQLCCKIFTKILEKFRLKTEEDCEKKPFFQRKCSSWRRCYGQLIAVLQNRFQKLRVKNPNMVCSNFKNETKTLFAWKTYFNPKYFFGNKKFDSDEAFENCHWGSGTIHPEVRKLLKIYTIYQNKVSFVLFGWRKKCTFDKAAAQFSL